MVHTLLTHPVRAPFLFFFLLLSVELARSPLQRFKKFSVQAVNLMGLCKSPAYRAAGCQGRGELMVQMVGIFYFELMIRVISFNKKL